MSDQSPDQLRAEIVQTRAELSRTVEQLAHKLDVKTLAAQKAKDLKPVLIKVAAGAGGFLALVLVVKRVRR